MVKICPSGLTMALFVLCVTTGHASDRVSMEHVAETSVEVDGDASYVVISPIAFATVGNRSLERGTLEIKVEASPGDEVELWMDLDEERLPWEEGAPWQRRRVWVVDERNEGRLRFDVTWALEVWAEGPPRPALLLRLAPDGEGTVGDLDLDEEGVVRFVARTRATEN